ncbi:MAG: DUF1573 domain-containing protein [Terriglobia bacterium]|nr:DUF1573 domain-containing protein [Terriglobia bacterium]
MRLLTRASLVFLLFLTLATELFAFDGPKAEFPQTTFQFGKVLRGSVVEHEFLIRNTGDQALTVKGVTMSVPLRLLHMVPTVPPGGEAKLKFALNTNEVGNFYEGMIVVATDDPAQPEFQLTFDGNIISTVEISPMPAFYVASQRGQLKEESLEIINHQPDPLHIESVESSSNRFTLRLVTIEDGQRYRLFLKMNPNAELGKKDELIRIHTTSKEHPIVNVGAHTYVRDHVYTFPPAVEFGRLRLADISDTKIADALTQRLVVYDRDRTDLQVRLSSDLPFLSMISRRATTGDRSEVFVSVDPARIAPGNYSGTIEIITNDARVPKLKVPVSIAVQR